jgi:hypothetical protein
MDDFGSEFGDDPADRGPLYHLAGAITPDPGVVGETYDNLWIVENDRVWDLGPADLDTDADGVADSMTRTGPAGMTVYTDTDRDGQVDLITEVNRDGGYRTSRLDPSSGRWTATDSGRLE